MTEEQPTPPRPGFGERMLIAIGAFLRALVRLIAIVLVLTLLGLGAFYLFPKLYTQYVLPLEENTMRIESVEFRQEQFQTQLTQGAADWRNRQATLEAQTRESRDEMEAIAQRLETAEANLQALVVQSEDAADTTLGRLDDLEAGLDELSVTLGALEESLSENQAALEALSEAAQGQDSPLAALRREVQVVKAMELLSRARLSFFRNNLGLVAQDVLAARDLLESLGTPDPALQAAPLPPALMIDLDNAVQRLDLVLQNLPDYPVLAADELEIAWQILAGRLTGSLVYQIPPRGTVAPVEGTSELQATPTVEAAAPTPTPTSSP